MNECQNFPGNKIPGQKISRQNIAGWKILGPENSGNTKFSWNSRKKIRENSRIFSLEGRKFQDFWLHLIPGLKILWQNFPGLFLPFMVFWGKTKTKPAFLGPDPRIPKWGHFPTYLHSGLLKSRRRVWILPYCIGDRRCITKNASFGLFWAKQSQNPAFLGLITSGLTPWS